MGHATLPERAAVAKILRLTACDGTGQTQAAIVLLILVPAVGLYHCIYLRKINRRSAGMHKMKPHITSIFFFFFFLLRELGKPSERKKKK